GGQTQIYWLPLSSGQFVRFTVRADDPASKIRVTFLSPDESNIDDLSGPVCPFSLYFLPTVSGLYRLRVELLQGTSSEETYKVQVHELREAAEQDKTRIRA